mgnify:FL=1
MDFVEWLLMPYAPGATVSILLLSIGVTFLTTFINSLFTKKEELATMKREISEWTSDFTKARRSGDKKLLAKVKKQEPHIRQLQSKMMWRSMKVSIIFMVPFFFMWQLLAMHYLYYPVAILPGFGELPVIWWYMLCSFLFGTLFSRVFGLTMEVT